eukprot:TRINITY_DN17262_c0_g1_i1.p2 TRINITY_DN17262_c0_g1~~TRINITY_DN17262_c0_g1_i1.p2  ORF type:complete len:152 (-),score=53.82 TRINITY_DN17262_c0_g1_i1:35-490(-)
MASQVTASAPERAEFATHVERELARVQHTLALLEMPAERVVQQYCALSESPSQTGLARILQLRGASEADITIASEQLRRLSPTADARGSPSPNPNWVPRPGAVVTQGPFRGEHTADGRLRVTGPTGLSLTLRRDAVFNRLWALLSAAVHDP